MIITNIEIDIINREIPDTGLDSDMGRFSGSVEQGILRIFTDEGIEGNCFIGEFRNGGGHLYDNIINVIKPLMIGRDATEREFLWSCLPLLSSRKSVSMKAWAPVDVALWDIAGKHANLPIYKLLGIQRTEIPAYATYPPRHTNVSGYLEEAKQVISQGFKAYKIHPGTMDTAEVIQMAYKIRQTVGLDIDLMLDPNCGYEFRKAYEIGKALDDNNFFWYEDPISHHNSDGISELSHKLQLPICMSDQSEHQFYYAANMIRNKTNRLIRGTASKLGITGLKKLASLCEAFGINCEIGTAGNSLLNIANLHVIYSINNCDYYEYWMPANVHQFGVYQDIEISKQGTIVASPSAGLGYEIDWEYIRSKTVRRLS